MHIALYSPSWPPAGAANGIVSYVATVKDHFASKGHRVSILSEGSLHLNDGRSIPLLPDAKDLAGFDRLKHRISGALDRWHGALPYIGRLLAAQVQAAHRIAPIDIFEMEESFGWSDTVRQLSGIPVVTRLHGPHFLKPPMTRTAREKRADLQRCHKEGRAVRSSLALTAPTQAIMHATCEHYQRTPGSSDAVIPNPVRLAPQDRRWTLNGCDRNHILMVGRFDYAKGADTMLLAFEKLRHRHPEARLTLVGPKIGIASDGGAVFSFEEFARAHLSAETAASIELTGTLNQDQIADLRCDAFVTVVASRAETFSFALVEGLAAGSPMLSTNWPASLEIIKDGDTGLLTPIGDADAMAQRLSWMFEHPEQVAQIGANGFLHCSRTFTADTVGERLLECYETTIASFGTRTLGR